MSSKNISRCMKRVCSKEYTRRQRNKHAVPYTLARNGCRITSCNPTCEATSFGRSLKLPKKLRKLPLYKRGEEWRLRFEKKRKSLFGTRKNILKNGFYVKLPKKDVRNARLRGEISGCYNVQG